MRKERGQERNQEMEMKAEDRLFEINEANEMEEDAFNLS
jgi:hypothetical protein